MAKEEECNHDKFPEDYTPLTGGDFDVVDKIIKDREAMYKAQFRPDGSMKTAREVSEESARFVEEFLGRIPPRPDRLVPLEKETLINPEDFKN